MDPNNFLQENHPIYKSIVDRQELLKLSPSKLYPWWWKACKVKMLLLTDGLNFGLGDFGLSTFVHTLVNDGRSYVKFEITIASISSFVGDPGISVQNSIPNFSFTNTSHFTKTKYDQIWLFGVNGRSLTLAEKKKVSEFMNAGGGVFATGDHGSLGNSLCGDLPRVRKMRRWNNSSGEVGMDDIRRNDTNHSGHDIGTQFDDQSDDIPQTIQPKLYSSYLGGFWKETYPHPILCSPNGILNVLPDHPHEGECIQPSNLSGNYSDGTPEFPGSTAPEIIAYSTVPAGNTASTKQATQTHSFGAICAYDGHKENIGRVTTDATWHHFVNVNLIGELNEVSRDFGQPEHNSKNRDLNLPFSHGFFHSIAGQQHFNKIKDYYINTAVWLSRESQIKCFNRRILWKLFHNHRIIEATLDNPFADKRKITPKSIFSIGTHALDVLGRRVGQCRKLRIVLPILLDIHPKIAELIDPWNIDIENKSSVPWVNLNSLIAFGLGGALVEMRDKFSGNKQKINMRNLDKKMDETVINGYKKGIKLGLKSLQGDIKLMKLK